jgi:hypothetical protein
MPKKFYEINPCIQKPVFFVAYEFPNKLEYLLQAFQGYCNTGAYPSGAPKFGYS